MDDRLRRAERDGTPELVRLEARRAGRDPWADTAAALHALLRRRLAALLEERITLPGITDAMDRCPCGGVATSVWPQPGIRHGVVEAWCSEQPGQPVGRLFLGRNDTRLFPIPGVRMLRILWVVRRWTVAAVLGHGVRHLPVPAFSLRIRREVWTAEVPEAWDREDLDWAMGVGGYAPRDPLAGFPWALARLPEV